MPKEYYAHSKENRPTSEWQRLEDHLENVAQLASDYAKDFRAAEWAKLAGNSHDLGKGDDRWQAWLRHVNKIDDEFAQYFSGHIKHAIYGAQSLYEKSKDVGKLLAYSISGHHGGLPNWSDKELVGLNSKLNNQFRKINFPHKKPMFDLKLPLKIIESEDFGFQLQFFVRMLFSCLVDADFLDTEAFLNPQQSLLRSSVPLSDFYNRFWKNFNHKRENSKKTKVNEQREIVLQNCLVSAKKPSGLFSLTVPTGGGKTLSSLAFALEHAKRNAKKRVVYVVPFTTIIEQNAKVFRDVLGQDAVLEHHCNFIPDDSDWKTRLASENWNSPIVVTTNVQFFESFFSNKPSKCRKLHNVSNSVIIFDEVQSIPVEKLKPCLGILNELSKNYGVTSVLCSATQPAIGYSEKFKSGLKDVTEIVKDIPGLFKKLKRTTETYIGEMDEVDLSENIRNHKQVLCIVNTRQQALDVYNALPKDKANFHLSALMYPAHRIHELKKIKIRLENNLPCRVVSTQIVEAGVDVDFPVVFRAIAGMDSIAQAAGRCNREGRNKKFGDVYIYKLKNGLPPGYFRQTAQCAELLFEEYKGRFLIPECIYEYFSNYYWMNEERMDDDGIYELCRAGIRGEVQFKDISKFKMISTAAVPVIIATKRKADKMVKSLEFIEYGTSVLRKLQQYTVQVYKHQFNELSAWLENPKPGVFVLRSRELYSKKTGLICSPPEGQAFFG